MKEWLAPFLLCHPTLKNVLPYWSAATWTMPEVPGRDLSYRLLGLRGISFSDSVQVRSLLGHGLHLL